jgi:hypothetical protein
MDAGFGAQPAKGVAALKADAGALDPRHFARRHFQQFGLETAPLAPAQVHPQQHLRPVLGFGATGAGLNVEKALLASNSPENIRWNSRSATTRP